MRGFYGCGVRRGLRVGSGVAVWGGSEVVGVAVALGGSVWGGVVTGGAVGVTSGAPRVTW